MAHIVAHTFVSPVVDDLDPNDVGPDEWNANHDITIDDTLINHNNLANLTVGDPHTQYFLESNAAALTRVNDTNVTLTLSAGAPTSLLNATSITVGWTGQLGLSRGGTHADLSATGGAGQYLKQASAGADITVGTIPASDIASGAALTRTNDTNVTVTLGGSPTVALLAATSLTLSWTGTLAVARGGIGVGTLASNGVLYGNGTGAVQALAVNATATKNFLTQTSSAAPAWATIVAGDLPGSFSGFANPTATVGTAAVNGSATTAMRSDGAPAINLTMSPSWTGGHTFTFANGDPVRMRSGAAGSFAYYSIGRTAEEGRFGVSGGAGNFFSEALAGDVALQNLSASTFLLLGEGNGANIVLADGSTRMLKNVKIGANSAPTAALDVTGNAVFSSSASEQISIVAGGATAVSTIAMTGRNTSADVTWYISNRAGNDSPTDRLAFYNNSVTEVVRYLATGSILTAGYVSVGSISAPTNVTAGDATAIRLMLGTSVAFDTNSYFQGGTGAILQINNSQGAAYATGGIMLTTPTAATNVQDQGSPGIAFNAKGWNTSGTPASANFQAAISAVAVQSAGLASSYIGFATASPTTGVYPFYSAKLIHGGVWDVATGLRIGGAAADGNILLGNGTNYVASSTSTVAVAYASGNFTSNTGSWTVDSGDQSVFAYQIVGKMMTVTWLLVTTSTTGTPDFLQISIPASKTAAYYTYNAVVSYDTASGVQFNGVATVQASGTQILIGRSLLGLFGGQSFAAYTNTLYTLGEITFPIL